MRYLTINKKKNPMINIMYKFFYQNIRYKFENASPNLRIRISLHKIFKKPLEQTPLTNSKRFN